MRSRMAYLIAAVLTVLSLGWWPGSAPALYAPAQDGLIASKFNNVILHQVTDPLDGMPKVRTWTLDTNFSGVWQLDWPVVEGGIVAWISKKKLTGESEYTWTVHYRIYDPGRGRWTGGEYDLDKGTNREVSSLIVKDGVVAWKASYEGADNPAGYRTYLVECVTYDPALGTWPPGGSYRCVAAANATAGPEHLRVKDGVVAWPTLPLEPVHGIHMRIYDPELHLWRENDQFEHWWYYNYNFDWLEIEDGTVHVKLEKGSLYFGYDSPNHRWSDFDIFWTVPWAYFVAQPFLGLAPLGVCFWDCSIALSGQFYHWIFGDGAVVNGVNSPVHKYPKAGSYGVTMITDYNNLNYFQSVKVNNPTLTGSISINGGAEYSNSTRLTVYLQVSDPDGALYRFRNYAYPEEGPEWYDWFPIRDTVTATDWVVSPEDEGPWAATVQLMDRHGVLSDHTAVIKLDFTPPAVNLTLNDGAKSTRKPQVTMNFSATDANGVDIMWYTAFNQGDTYTIWSLWEPYHAMNKTLTFNSKPGKKTVIFHVRDKAGNVSEKIAEIILKPSPLPGLHLLLK